MHLGILTALGFLTATLGTVGGLGGATILVPLLVLSGMEPSRAAPLGLLSVAAASLAAGASQIEEGLVHHRLGVTIETFAGTGALAGAVASGVLSASVLTRTLALVAIVAAALVTWRRESGAPAEPAFTAETAGEWPGTLSGMYIEHGQPVPYGVKNLPLGLAGAAVAGVVAGVSGTGGGFIKTPVMSDVMGVPLKVAAATTTFTLGITASAALAVHAGLGHIEGVRGAAIVAGSLVGGRAGAWLQRRLPVRVIRLMLAALLAVVGGVLLVRGG